MTPASAQRDDIPADTRRAYYDQRYDPQTTYKYIQDDDAIRRAAELKRKTRRWLAVSGVDQNREARVLELGCGNGLLRDVHPGWIGVDLSFQACQNALQAGAGRVINADLECLPFAEASFDVVFTWATLEHIPHPDKAMSELARVLRPGGMAIVGPSWHCRSWTVKRLRFRPYSDLPWRLKIEKALIPLRNLFVWRVAGAIPNRLFRELRMLGGQLPLDYRPLVPDMNPNLPHVSDDDAFASIDAHAGICYFASRGWRCISHPGLVKRILARHEEVVVIKAQTNVGER